MAATPTSRTLERLRKDGWLAQTVERYCPFSRRRHDLFGIIDVIAILDSQTLAVQATSSSNVSSRVRKITDSPNLSAIRDAGWAIQVWGWRKTPTGRWTHRIVDVS